MLDSLGTQTVQGDLRAEPEMSPIALKLAGDFEREYEAETLSAQAENFLTEAEWTLLENARNEGREALERFRSLRSRQERNTQSLKKIAELSQTLGQIERRVEELEKLLL